MLNCSNDQTSHTPAGQERPVHGGLSQPAQEAGSTGHQTPWQLGMCVYNAGLCVYVWAVEVVVMKLFSIFFRKEI